MKNTRVKIEVIDESNKPVRVIERVVWRESIGNFFPVFCRYKGEKHLVKSTWPGLDDPFRFNEFDHLGRLFIQV